MDTNQANYMGYAVGARIALRHTDHPGIKQASTTVEDLNARVGEFVNLHSNRMQKRAARVQKLYQTICS